MTGVAFFMITKAPESHLRIKMPRTSPLYVRGIVFSIVLSGCEPVVIGSVGVCGSETLCSNVCVDVQTDFDNCGACGLVCGGTCAFGRCAVALATAQSGPEFIAVDPTSVYWTNETGGTIMKSPVGGGAATTLASGQSGPEFIAVDATSVYWTTENGLTVAKAPLAGGPPTTLSSGKKALGIAVSGSVYWTTGNQVLKTPLDGGTSTALASEPQPGYCNGPQGVAVDATSVYWTNAGSCAGPLPEVCTGDVRKVSLSGGTVEIIANMQGNPEAIAVDDTSVYWTNCQSNTLMSAPKNGGKAITLVSGQGQPQFIAVDDTSVYWTTGVGGTVMKVPLGGGKSTTLVSGKQFSPLGIAVDDTSVYWTNVENGTVFRLSPK